MQWNNNIKIIKQERGYIYQYEIQIFKVSKNVLKFNLINNFN